MRFALNKELVAIRKEEKVVVLLHFLDDWCYVCGGGCAKVVTISLQNLELPLRPPLVKVIACLLHPQQEPPYCKTKGVTERMAPNLKKHLKKHVTSICVVPQLPH